MQVFDTRSFFPEDTKFGKNTYIRFRLSVGGGYEAEFHWAEYGTETRIKVKGHGTALSDDTTMAFHTGKLERLDGVLQYLCPQFPIHYWESIKRLAPLRKMDA